uniref:Uncharacterized protein n=1 Tax=Toxoplasma gondii COUG TaxID=1074873 RepID=A0A2G8Y1Q9_TOXGO|nr:hypothetical protein TGCOUG_267990 [Toxoplasma gondii COUG]
MFHREAWLGEHCGAADRCIVFFGEESAVWPLRYQRVGDWNPLRADEPELDSEPAEHANEANSSVRSFVQTPTDNQSNGRAGVPCDNGFPAGPGAAEPTGRVFRCEGRRTRGECTAVDGGELKVTV